jgi:glycosyltransferase involved in cell wall biosynthesis
MRIAYITAGAASMYCGSCMHDNTLVSALRGQGHDALLIPTYTPIRTDEEDVSLKRVFFGGINVYLQQKAALFRHTPWRLDRLLDAPWLLRWVSRFAVKTEAGQLGDLTISILKGEHGNQKKEVEKIADWLASEVKPDVVHLSNVIISGMVPELKRRLAVPILGELQGDDIFLEALPEPFHTQALDLIRTNCREFSGFVATCRYYAEFMANYLDIPRERIDVVYPGINLKGHGPRPLRNAGAVAGVSDPGHRPMPVPRPPLTIGYFARICPEKGLHVLVEAFRILRQTSGAPPCKLRASGWLGEHNRPYLDDLRNQLQSAGLGDSFEYVDSPDHASKVRFLQSLDVLSVPTIYREPKGLYVLEALANGVPVVQPRHGSFPELIEATGGGLLVEPEEPEDLARGLKELLADDGRRQALGEQGQEAVHQRFTADRMARETIAVYQQYLSRPQPAGSPS